MGDIRQTSIGWLKIIIINPVILLSHGPKFPSREKRPKASPTPGSAADLCFKAFKFCILL